MRKKLIAAAAGAAALGVAAGGVAIAGAASGSSGSDSAAPAAAAAPSRLDDGKDLLPQATITEADAIAAAQGAASGALDEVDLEHHAGRLVFNVDVGASDVKVDAATGQVVANTSDD
jgi:uncharacterized membrane protein YkoI